MEQSSFIFRIEGESDRCESRDQPPGSNPAITASLVIDSAQLFPASSLSRAVQAGFPPPLLRICILLIMQE